MSKAKSVPAAKRQEVEAKTLEIFRQQFGANDDELDLDTDVTTEWHSDDLDILEVVMELEEAFDVSIKDGTYDDAKKPSDFVTLVLGLL